MVRHPTRFFCLENSARFLMHKINKPPTTRPAILYLEVKPVHTANEVGGFSKAATRRRGVLVAATLTADGELRVFRGDECRELAAHLRSARQVVGYNCLRFDYELIRGQAPFRKPPTTDLFILLEELEGRRCSLDQAIQKHLGGGKTPSSDSVTKAALAEKHESVARALKRHLLLLLRLHQHVCPQTLS